MSDYIIEHPTKGVLVSQEYDPIDGDPETNYRSRWSWSKPRTAGLRLVGMRAAEQAMARLPESVRAKSNIRVWGGDWILVP